MEPNAYTQAMIVNFEITERRRIAHKARRANLARQRAPIQPAPEPGAARWRFGYWLQRQMTRLVPALR